MGTPALDLYHIGNKTAVHVPGLSRRELFSGMRIAEDTHKEHITLTTEILRRLRSVTPQFIDDTVIPNDYQCPGVFAVTYYEVPLERGTVVVQMEVHDNLGSQLLGNTLSSIYDNTTVEQQAEVAERFNGKGGLLFTRKMYHWRGNNGHGLILGQPPEDFPQEGPTEQVGSCAFMRAINMVWQGKEDLSREVVHGDVRAEHLLWHSSTRYPLEVFVRDTTLARLRAGDGPIAETMAWMREHVSQVNTVAELARLAAMHWFMADSYRKRKEPRQVSTGLSDEVECVGNDYLRQAQDSFRKLHPPNNNRMDYVVH